LDTCARRKSIFFKPSLPEKWLLLLLHPMESNKASVWCLFYLSVYLSHLAYSQTGSSGGSTFLTVPLQHAAYSQIVSPGAELAHSNPEYDGQIQL